MARLRIEGSFVASVTPFNEDGAIDFGAFRTLIDFQQRHGTAAMLFMGSTGEPSLLSPEEKKRIVVRTRRQASARVTYPRAAPMAQLARARPTPAMLEGAPALVLSGRRPFSGFVSCQK